MDKYKAKILDIKDEYNLVKTYEISAPEEIYRDEGSSFHIALPGYDKDDKIDKKLIHHLSINTLKDEGVIRFSTKLPIKKSPFKKALSKLIVGDELTIYDIRSNMKLRREDKKIVLLSMGLSISTMRPLIRKFISDPKGITEMISINVIDKDKILFKEEWSKIDNNLLEMIRLTDRKTYFEYIENLSSKKDNIFYVVGSELFVFDTLSILLKNGVLSTDIVIDKEKDKRDIVFDKIKNYKVIY